MDFESASILVAIVFFLVTLPLLAIARRLARIARIMSRIESMNLRSLQRWGG
ncbi:MAG TPA: hypothetical protein VE996_00310 [Terriglobales bacterium]|nr:hypothetical protein [Terriglobales bacterium]